MGWDSVTGLMLATCPADPTFCCPDGASRCLLTDAFGTVTKAAGSSAYQRPTLNSGQKRFSATLTAIAVPWFSCAKPVGVWQSFGNAHYASIKNALWISLSSLYWANAACLSWVRASLSSVTEEPRAPRLQFGEQAKAEQHFQPACDGFQLGLRRDSCQGRSAVERPRGQSSYAAGAGQDECSSARPLPSGW